MVRSLQMSQPPLLPEDEGHTGLAAAAVLPDGHAEAHAAELAKNANAAAGGAGGLDSSASVGSTGALGAVAPLPQPFQLG